MIVYALTLAEHRAQIRSAEAHRRKLEARAERKRVESWDRMVAASNRRVGRV